MSTRAARDGHHPDVEGGRGSAEREVGEARKAGGEPGEAVRPQVVVSRCLGFDAVRYNGRILRSRFVEALRDHVDFVEVCPEVEIGLGVPRDPIRVEVAPDSDEDAGPAFRKREGGVHLVQPSTGRDLTRAMSDFSRSYLDGLGGVDGFILKSRSPSCAFRDAKVFTAESEGRPLRRGPGLFAGAVADTFPWAAMEDDERLTDPRLRHHFLTHLWALARLRRVAVMGGRPALGRYHASYELLLSTLGPEVTARLGRIVTDPGERSAAALAHAYRSALGEAFRSPPRTGDSENAVRSWAARFDREHLDARLPFEPYPRPLLAG